MAATGAQIRRARRANGWTQTQLAVRAGVSQPFVSAVERGGVASGQGLAAILAALELDPSGDHAEPDNLRAPSYVPDWVPQVQYEALPLPLAVDAYVRPRAGGDFALTAALRDREVLIACVDVGGRGAAALPASAYLQGWIRGYVAALGASPRLSHLAERLDAVLRETKIEAGWFLALVAQPRSAPPHTVSYTGIARGFPRPLLLGAGAATRPAVPDDVSAGEPVSHVLHAPWTLVVASDGLLHRLGAGNEQEGRVTLRNWQRGTRRAIGATERFASGAGGTDDEVALVVRWDDWDRVERLQARDPVARLHEVKRTLHADAAGHVGTERARALGAAAAEAIDNVRQHAYGGGQDGPLTLRWRREGVGFRVEIEDAGVGAIKEDQGFAVMRGHADEVEWYTASGGGTVVSIAIRSHEER